MSKRDVLTWKSHVEELVAVKMQSNRAPYDATSQWVAGLDPALHKKLVKVGLAEPCEPSEKPEQMTLGAFLDRKIAERDDVKDGTATVYGHTRRCLMAIFGANKPLSQLTPGDADDWRRFLMRPKKDKGQGLSESTTRRRCGIAKQFLADAVARGYIDRNPFAGMKNMSILANRERDHFVSREVAEKVIAACPDKQWQLLFALSHFGGLRCQSEHLAMTSGDVDFETGRIVVRSRPSSGFQALLTGDRRPFRRRRGQRDRNLAYSYAVRCGRRRTVGDGRDNADCYLRNKRPLQCFCGYFSSPGGTRTPDQGIMSPLL